MRTRILPAALLLVACAAPSARPAAAQSQRASAGAPRGTMGGMMGAMMAGARGDTAAAPEPRAQRADSAAHCPPVKQAGVDAGRAVFESTGNCIACHGANAAGTVLGPNLSDAQWLTINGSYGSIVRLVRTGVAKPTKYRAPMPPLGGGALTASQVCDVAAYVYSLSHH
jgi:mono/diheme cytochrome c family protein